jgi:hypothetical protein
LGIGLRLVLGPRVIRRIPGVKRGSRLEGGVIIDKSHVGRSAKLEIAVVCVVGGRPAQVDPDGWGGAGILPAISRCSSLPGIGLAWGGIIWRPVHGLGRFGNRCRLVCLVMFSLVPVPVLGKGWQALE